MLVQELVVTGDAPIWTPPHFYCNQYEPMEAAMTNPTIPEKCPSCGADYDHDEPGSSVVPQWECGSYESSAMNSYRPGEFVQSELCRTRQELAEVKASANDREKQAAVKALEAALKQIECCAQSSENYKNEIAALAGWGIYYEIRALKIAVERDGLKALEGK
jgi:hypothetical protein